MNNDNPMKVDEVETCEVKFVPLEDDSGVFSGGEESYYSDNDPVPVVLEEKVEVEDEGDVKEVIEIDDESDDDDEVDTEFERKMADKRTIQRVFQGVGEEEDEAGDGLEEFMKATRTKLARF